MKVVIVMPYYRRFDQLINTLLSIRNTKYENVEIIIINDDIPDLVLPYIGICIHILKTDQEEKNKNGWVMSLPQMNRGMKKALEKGADIVILQNCECRHYGDVILDAVEHVNENNYISYPCFSLSKQSTFNQNIELEIEEIIEKNNKCATDDQHDSWYNHYLYRGTGYDFCAAITAENLKKLNGYDERYCHNYCYGDDDFVMRIKRLGLFIDIPERPMVLHQWHGNSYGKREGIEKNAALYSEIANNETGFKAKHLFTEDFA